MGMSAPPIGMMSRIPKARARTMINGKRYASSSGFQTRARPQATATPRSPMLIVFWKG